MNSLKLEAMTDGGQTGLLSADTLETLMLTVESKESRFHKHLLFIFCAW